MSSFDRLLEQIDAFIRKFYKNEMLRGLLLFVAIFLVSFLFVTTLEYFGRFSSTLRAIFFFSFIGVNLYVLGRFIIIPLAKLFSIGKRIDRYKGAKIIGEFFPNVSDRLLNTLQLNDTANQNVGNLELIRASVSQRASTLSVLPFSSAIDLSSNKRFIKYILPSIFLIVGLSFFLPGLLTQGTERVVNFNTEYIPQAPYSFNLVNTDLLLEEGQDATINVNLDGALLPDQLYIDGEKGRFLMEKSGKNSYMYVLKNVTSKTKFWFNANEFKSAEYFIQVNPKASLGKLTAKVIYPKYLGKINQEFSNINDLSVPEGSLIQWNGQAKNSSDFRIQLNDTIVRSNNETIDFSKKFFTDSKLKVSWLNKFNAKKDSTAVQISVIKDAYPIVLADEIFDSLKSGVRFFQGSCSDDYGLNSLNFVYTISRNGRQIKSERINVKTLGGLTESFKFTVDFMREELQIKDRVEYYFVVNDNDGVHGSKSSKSEVFTYELPSLQELNDQKDANNANANKSLEAMMNKVNDFNKKVDALKKDVRDSKKQDWNQLNQVQQLQQNQQQMQQEMQQMQEQLQEQMEEKDQLSETDPELLEQMKMIEELMKEVMDDELKELLDKLEEMMKNQDKNKIQDKMEEVEKSSEDMKKQMDRTMEMLKKLQVNEKIDDVEKELNELAKEQLELKNELDKNKTTPEEVAKKEEKLQEKFDAIKKELKELDSLNKALDKPMNLDMKEELQKEIEEEMKGAKGDAKAGKKKDSSDKQKKAGDKMKELAESMDAQQKEENIQEKEEDVETLRAILENLMTLSFDEEKLIFSFNKVTDTDPMYRKFGRKQRSIIDDTKIVEDSLMALAKRVPKIATFIDDEMKQVNSNLSLTLEDIDEHRRREMGQHQQLVMTSYNNLALLLNESLQNMQQDMQSQKPGSGSCDKPGGSGKGKPSMGKGKPGMSPGDMKEMLKKQLDSMEKGKNPGGKKPGESQGGSTPSGQPGQGMPGLGNKEVAKMAAQQTAMRQQLEKLRQEMNKEGQGKGNQLNKLIEEMEKQERDLINKKFSPEMIKRQKDIMTRLLESEKALMERGFEDKRESNDGKNRSNSNLIRFDEYTKMKTNQIEILRVVDPSYHRYYKDRANEYFNKMN
jgi:hypothetical protein